MSIPIVNLADPAVRLETARRELADVRAILLLPDLSEAERESYESLAAILEADLSGLEGK